LTKLGIDKNGLAPMTLPAPIASVSPGRIALAACLLMTVGIVSVQGRPLKRPAPADLAKQHEQNVESPQSKADKAAKQSVPAQPAPAQPIIAQPAADQPAAAEVIKQREQELDSLRTEQQQATEAERKLAAENEMLSEDRRKLTASLIEGATRIRADEERVTAAETRMHELEGSEAAIRKSLTGRRALIAEVLAALQRIGHHPPPAVFAGAQDALESIRTAMTLGAVLPEMRVETETLMTELAGLGRVRKDLAIERDRQASEITELGAAQKRMSALVEERQKRQAEVEHAMDEERQRVLALGRQADNLKDLIAKLEQAAAESAKRAERLAARPVEESKPSDAKSDAKSEAKSEAKSGPSRPVAPKDPKEPTRLAPVVAFAAAKGTLLLPANGVKLKDFGASDRAGGTEKGISIATRAGAQVTAPSDGWVVYAAPYRSYGQLLILNVGGGYHVLLAGMERITVDLGQFVLTGEPVAVMGNGTQVASTTAASTNPVTTMTTASDSGSPSSGSPTAGTTQPVLYIEFRKDGTPVDPTPWWAATNSEKVRG
jgi:septal ring factor EnvC (AmiA/AmiB activator)